MQRKEEIDRLNKEIAAIRKNCWNIEDSLIETKDLTIDAQPVTFEEALIQLEQKCNIHFQPPKKDKHEPLDFKERKLKEFDERLLNVEANKKKLDAYGELLSTLRLRLNSARKEYPAQQSALEVKSNELEAYCIKHKNELTAFIDSLPVTEKLALWRSIDGVVTFKILMAKFEALRKLNDAAAEEQFTLAFGQSLKIFWGKEKKIPDTIQLEKLFSLLFPDRKNPENPPVSMKDHLENFSKLPANQVTLVALRKILNEVFLKQFLDKLIIKLKEIDPAEKKVKSQTAYDNFFAHLRTEIYLATVIESYKFTDELKSAGTVGQVWSYATGGVTNRFTKMSVEQVENPYTIIHLLSHSIRMPQDESQASQAIFLDVCIMLKALYDRCYRQVPPRYRNNDPERTIKPAAKDFNGDVEDFKFSDNKADDKRALVKISLAEKHKPHSLTILSRLEDHNCKLLTAELKAQLTSHSVDDAQVALVAVAPVPAPVVSLSVPGTTPPAAVAKSPPTNAAALSHAHTTKPAAPVLFPAPPTEPKEMLYKDVIDKIHDSMLPTAKLNLLLGYLNKHELNFDQIEAIRKVKQVLINTLTKYKDAWFTSSWVPTLFVRRPHANDAKKTLENMDHITPVDLLKAYIQLGLNIAGKKSYDLFPSIMREIESLISVFKELATSRPTPKEEPKLPPADSTPKPKSGARPGGF